jgi:signal transduction histidine kinase
LRESLHAVHSAVSDRTDGLFAGWFAELAPTLGGQADRADIKQLLHTMRTSSTHLLDIINDLLDLR